MIKKIYTLGTSFTKGGGFEFDLENHGDSLRKLYSHIDDEKTQWSFSWPGQLQKLFDKNKIKVEVINLAKSGYGNERLIRKTYETILDKSFKKEETLFLFEFSATGRKEFYNKELGYIVGNYHFTTDKRDSVFIVGEEEKEISTNLHGLSKTYFEDDENTLEKLKKIEKVYSEYTSHAIDYKSCLKELSIDCIGFLSFCDRMQINYSIVSRPFMEMDFQIEFFNKFFSEKSLEIVYDGKVTNDVYMFFDEHKLKIKDETNGQLNDGHGGYLGNKLFAEQLFEKVKNWPESLKNNLI